MWVTRLGKGSGGCSIFDAEQFGLGFKSDVRVWIWVFMLL